MPLERRQRKQVIKLCKSQLSSRLRMFQSLSRLMPHTNPETPMDVDQESKGTVGSMKRKAEEGPPEESKKAKVGACTPASCLLDNPY
jgi:hypothetical protein